MDDAVAGQLALACCDCISAFVHDAIVRSENATYLEQLFNDVVGSAEFEQVPLTLRFLLSTDEGQRFCWRFLGAATPEAVPMTLNVYRKKARMMAREAPAADVVLHAQL